METALAIRQMVKEAGGGRRDFRVAARFYRKSGMQRVRKFLGFLREDRGQDYAAWMNKTSERN